MLGKDSKCCLLRLMSLVWLFSTRPLPVFCPSRRYRRRMIRRTWGFVSSFLWACRPEYDSKVAMLKVICSLSLGIFRADKGNVGRAIEHQKRAVRHRILSGGEWGSAGTKNRKGWIDSSEAVDFFDDRPLRPHDIRHAKDKKENTGHAMEHWASRWKGPSAIKC